MNSVFHKFLNVDKQMRLILVEAVFSLFVVKFLLLFLPVKNVKNYWSSSINQNKEIDLDSLNKIKWALHNANKLAFWKNKCLVQSIAGRWMLHRRGIASILHFGVNKDRQQKLIAHAWLTVGDFEVVAAKENYKELMNY